MRISDWSSDVCSSDLAGIVFNPISSELYWAEKGVGAFLNDKRLRVSGRRKLEDAVVATGIPHRGRPAREAFEGELSRVMPEVAGVRRMGAASLDLAYVAAGRYEGYWETGLNRSEERREGKEWVRKCKCGWSPKH